MPIPAQFNGDLSLWVNDIIGRLGDKNTEFMFLKRYWGSLTAAQKTAVKSAFVAMLNTAKTDIDSVIAEVNAA